MLAGEVVVLPEWKGEARRWYRAERRGGLSWGVHVKCEPQF